MGNVISIENALTNMGNVVSRKNICREIYHFRKNIHWNKSNNILHLYICIYIL